jgi:ATP-dependent protease ClpP protease subunit
MKRSRFNIFGYDTSEPPTKKVRIDNRNTSSNHIIPMIKHHHTICDDVYSVDNHIFFNTDVSVESVDKLTHIINKKNKEFSDLKLNVLVESIKPVPLHLHITSYGGGLLAGFKAADAIERSKIPIHTIVDGYAASAGSLMAIVGKKRYITKRSYILIHQLSGGSWGKFNEIEDSYNNKKLFMDSIVDMYVSHTNMTREMVVTQLAHDNWWNLQKCLEVGLVDEIYL